MREYENSDEMMSYADGAVKEREKPEIPPLEDVLGNCYIGQIVTYGRYPQSSADGSELEPIPWVIVDVRFDRVRLLSLYGLDSPDYYVPANLGGGYPRIILSGTWRDSYIRNWLNENFYNRAFNAEEKSWIIDSVVELKDGGTKTILGNEYTWEPEVKNKVVLLSIQDVVNLELDVDTKKCKATNYAKANKAKVGPGGFCNWWLTDNVPGKLLFAAVDKTGKNIFAYDSDNMIDRPAVRPSIWVLR